MEFTRHDPFAAEQLAREAAEISSTLPAVDTLHGMGLQLLDLLRDAATNAGRDLPTRQVVYMAPIPADCEQAAALFNGWSPWPVQIGPTIQHPFRWMAGFSLIITRNSPAVPRGGVKKTVSPEQMLDASHIASADAELLLAVTNRLVEVGPDLSVVAHAPQGALQTVELNVQLLSVGSF